VRIVWLFCGARGYDLLQPRQQGVAHDGAELYVLRLADRGAQILVGDVVAYACRALDERLTGK
jgi:hypothetical protein